MKRFACGDVVPGCTAEWQCDTEVEVLAAVAEHALLVHGLPTLPDELVETVRSKIRPAG